MCWGLQTGVDGLEGMGVCLIEMCVSKCERSTLLIPFIQGQLTHMGECFINEHVMKAEDRRVKGKADETWQEREKEMIKRSLAHRSYQPCLSCPPHLPGCLLCVWVFDIDMVQLHRDINSSFDWSLPCYRSAALTPPRGMFTCPHTPAFPEASSASLRFWRWPHHLIKICWFSFPAISSLAPAFSLWPWHAGVDRWWTIYLLWICFEM